MPAIQVYVSDATYQELVKRARKMTKDTGHEVTPSRYANVTLTVALGTNDD